MAAPLKRLAAKRVAIVGAGPSGMAAVKYLNAERAFDAITVFEQRRHVGGIWRYTAQHSGDGMFDVPQTNPHVGLEQPVAGGNSDTQSNECQFLSPIYERLETNIPKSLMGYSDTPWADHLQVFPRHEDVQEYLEAYGAELIPSIKFMTQVTRVTPAEDDSWLLEYKDLHTKKAHAETFDAVVVATGHFSVPYVPEIEGLAEWNQRHPGSVSHSKYFRAPEPFKEKKVVVIGSSASGLDIASQISTFCRKPLLLSQRSVSDLAAGFANDPDISVVPQITHVDANGRTVFFSDGRIEQDVDELLFCTGYLYSFPFLESLEPNPISDGTRVEHTYKHLFYAPRPTLAFLTLNQKIIPFPLAEAQSAVLARVWSGRLTLPSTEEMVGWEKSVIDECGSGGKFHVLKFPKDAEYINELYDWAVSAEKVDGLENDGTGKLPKRWGAWEYWARENFPKIRKAFIMHGEGRKDITTLKQLGFEFPDSGEAVNKGRESSSVSSSEG
ncbi:uncharacterized protein PV09_05528 [Verruconis gallopava]|uniref:FAD/NAD(P)-binding domain-containing protein n=1 Tax=Verruconis gallopava TaxID=253628 RepID=A0A0D1YRR7_9PEZI|nr:uncharacterized protein PV09_05528 [Verruconis gallopava]KIW03317.1 hypothetical protein PV09_05528 [Verruconis gallopava]